MKDVEEVKKALSDGYDHSFWSCSVSKLGYSGTAIISWIKPISVRYGTPEFMTWKDALLLLSSNRST